MKGSSLSLTLFNSALRALTFENERARTQSIEGGKHSSGQSETVILFSLFMALLSPKVDRQQPKEGREEDEEQAKTTLSEPDVTRTSVTIGPTLPRTF